MRVDIDGPLLPSLVDTTAKNFTLDQVSADRHPARTSAACGRLFHVLASKMVRMSQPPLNYQTPQPRPPKDDSGCLPYIVFAICAGVAGFAFMLIIEERSELGAFILLPAALGAIVLPILIMLHTRLHK